MRSRVCRRTATTRTPSSRRSRAQSAVVESTVDGTFSDGGTGMFRELYASLTEGASWHKAPTTYFLMRDFIEYCDARLAVNRRTQRAGLGCNGWGVRLAKNGGFPPNITILEYARDIWHV